MPYIFTMQPVCIRSYLKSVLRYKFLIFYTYRMDAVFIPTWARMWGSVVICRSQDRSASNKVWETLAYAAIPPVGYHVTKDGRPQVTVCFKAAFFAIGIEDTSFVKRTCVFQSWMRENGHLGERLVRPCEVFPSICHFEGSHIVTDSRAL